MRRPRHVATLSALASVLVVAAAFPAQGLGAVAGEPDPSFGSGGFTIFDEPSKKDEFLSDLLVLPDGKILGAGSRGGLSGFLLARFNSNGSPDLSFGGEGFKVEPDLGQGGDPRGIEAIEERADGKFVVAGDGRAPVTGVDAFEFGRYLPNGNLDPSFGEGGLTTVPMNEFGGAAAMDQAPDGKIVATGNSGTNLLPFQLAVVRVTESGKPDASFSTVPSDGVRVINVPGSLDEEGYAVKVLGNGTILVGGWAENGAFLAEVDSEGNLVSGFGKNGVAVDNLGTAPFPSGEIYDLKVLPDGSIIAVGDAFVAENDEEGFVARFTPTGQLDPSFGAGGILRLNPTSHDDLLYALEIDGVGRIVAAGRRGDDDLTNTADTWLVRLTPDGHLDPSFGSGGETDVNVVPQREFVSGLALQLDGRAVIAGDVFAESEKMLIGRFTADPQPIKVSLVAAKARCGGRKATIVGTRGADRLKGTKKADVIAGLGGNDRISALAGNDVVCGGKGKDVINGGPGKDKLLGEAGKDTLVGGKGKDKLLGGSGKDVCNGGAGKDAKAAGCETRKKLP